MKKLLRHWKSIYLACSLVYVGWVILIGIPEFHKINRQYRVLVSRLEPVRIRAVALEELDSECRRKSWQRNIPEETACSSWSPEVVEARIHKVQERLEQDRKRGFIKIALFYVSLVLIVLLFPPLFTYLFILGIVMVCKNIKIVR